MGIAPSQRPVHLFPPPPAQLSHITPLSHSEEDRHKMDIALRLTERLESWFGKEHSPYHPTHTHPPTYTHTHTHTISNLQALWSSSETE